MTTRRLLLLLGLTTGLFACSGSGTNVTAPAPAPPPPPTASAAATAPSQAFVEADREVEYVFTDPDRRKKIEAAFPAIDAMGEEELRARRAPGFVIGVVIDGELAYARGFGVADVEKNRKVDADTVFLIASATKPFTAEALLALRDEGALSVNDPLTRALPEASGIVYPTHDSGPITFRQVLTHTAGLPRDAAFMGGAADHTVTEEEIAASLAGLGLVSPPGTRFSYSNLGYGLIGLAIARTSHVPLRTFVQKRLFEPLGMAASTFDAGAVPADRLALPYARDGAGAFVRRPILPLGAAVGHNGIYTSLRDLGRFVAFQLDAYPPRSAPEKGPLKRSTVREAHFDAVKATGLGSADRYGYGWMSVDTCDLGRLVWHSGEFDGYGSWAGFLPEAGVGVIAMANHIRSGGLGQRTMDVLRKSGSLSRRAPRMKRLSREMEAVMPRFLSVLADWNEEGYRAMLAAGRPDSTADEREELAGYRALHGRCTGYTPVEITSPFTARFAMKCERGSLEMEIVLDPLDGRIDGFTGTSRGIEAPPALSAGAGRLASLLGRWDDRTYEKHLALVKRPRDEIRAQLAKLGEAHGRCEVRSFRRVVNQPFFDLGCERGGDLELTLATDDKHPEGKVTSYSLRELRRGPGGDCSVP